MSVFQKPNKVWYVLLSQRSWADLCDVDFAHAMAYGSTERVKIFFKARAGQPQDLVDHLPALAASITKNTFQTPKWTASKIEKMVEFLYELNRTLTSNPQENPPMARMIEALVRHSGDKLSITANSPLFFIAVRSDSDLLENLLQRIDGTARLNVVEQLFSQERFHMSSWSGINRSLFTANTVRFLPEFTDRVVEHMCQNLMWDLNINLSISQRLKRRVHNVLERVVVCEPVLDVEQKVWMEQKKIETFEKFVDLHQNAFSDNHWKSVLELFNKIAKRHDVSHATVLQSYAMRTTLGKAVDTTFVPQRPVPPKRKM